MKARAVIQEYGDSYSKGRAQAPMARDLSSPPRTTVVIPVYNTEDYLPACLDSVLAQTQREIEVILVDDGSTDGSLEIERAYAAADSRVRVIQQPNLRQGTARNRGLAEAKGEYVYFMDSDDLLVSDCFEACYQACKCNNLDFATFDSAGFLDDPDIERPELFPEMCDRSEHVACGVMDGPTFWGRYFPTGMTPFICWLEYFDRSFLLENDLWFIEGIYFEDNDWIARVFMAAERMQYIPRKLHRYRDRPGSNVHAGFTHALADSCFDVHAILCDLAQIESDSARLRVLQDVSAVKDIRFRQFAELEPIDELREKALASAQAMRKNCLDATLSAEVRMMHLMAFASLAQGVSAWPDISVPFDRELVVSVLHEGFPGEGEVSRLGIYGTGKACQAFLRFFDAAKCGCVFLETSVEPGQTFQGAPVHAIDEAADLALDAIVITSAKFADEMRTNVKRVMGDGVPVYIVPRGILRIADIPVIDRLES